MYPVLHHTHDYHHVTFLLLNLIQLHSGHATHHIQDYFSGSLLPQYVSAYTSLLSESMRMHFPSFKTDLFNLMYLKENQAIPTTSIISTILLSPTCCYSQSSALYSLYLDYLYSFIYAHPQSTQLLLQQYVSMLVTNV